MYGQQQAQQQVQPNQQTMMNQMGPTRMILPGNRMPGPGPQPGMINSGMQQQPQQPVSNTISIFIFTQIKFRSNNSNNSNFWKNQSQSLF